MEAVLEYVEAEPRSLFLDMAEVSSIDSSGLGALIFIHKTWGKQGQELFLIKLSPMVKKFFRTTGLLGHFRCVDSVEQSMESQIEKTP